MRTLLTDKIDEGRELLHQALPSLFRLGVGRLAVDGRERYKNKLDSEIGKSKMKLRKCLSEHPFGTIKCWMGYIPLLLRGKIKVQTELNIYVIAYNFKRLFNVASFEDLEKLYKPSPMKVA